MTEEQNKLADRLAKCKLHVPQDKFFHGNILVPTDLLANVIDALRADRESSTMDDIPLCAVHADWWFTSRNHLKGDTSCVVCAFNPARELATEAVLEGLRNSPCGRLLQQEVCLQDALVDANCEPCDCWRAALKGKGASQGADGDFVRVPREPTDAQRHLAMMNDSPGYRINSLTFYRAMLQAAAAEGRKP